MTTLHYNSNGSNIDSTSSHYIKLQIQYGADLHELLLSNKDNKIRVEHVLNEIEKLTKVPKCHQTVIYKGQRLDNRPKANLEDLYVFNNSKLTLNGTQRQYHDKYCCPDHDHNHIMNSSSKDFDEKASTNKQTNRNKMINEHSLTDKQMVSAMNLKAHKSDSKPIGFEPERNKIYEYYTIPYKTDPTTLLKSMPISTSNKNSER